MINSIAKTLIKTDEETSFNRRRRMPKSLVAGLIMLAAIILLCTFGPMLNPTTPIQQDLKQRFAAPSLEHPMGTDNYGRDIWVRVLAGGQVDIMIAILATLLSLIVGAIIGLWAGFFGGWIDTLLMRLLDINLAFPMIVLMIAIVAMLGSGIVNIYIAIIIISWVYYARLTRGECLIVKNKEFVQAARALGSSNSRIILRHIFPNVVSGALVYAASDAVLNIIFVGTLGYLGLGIQPPAPEWGSMVAASQTFLANAPGMLIYPSIAIVLTGIAFSLIGDGLADMMRRGNSAVGS